MTLKYDHLVDFIAGIKKQGYRKQIPRKYLDFFIAKRFGISKYTKDSVVKGLIDLGFLKNTGIGIFEICDGWKPDCIKQEKKAKK